MKNKEKNNMTTFGAVEYKMPVEMAKAYLKNRKGEDKKLRPIEYLCKVVNEEFGVKGHCVNVIQY